MSTKRKVRGILFSSFWFCCGLVFRISFTSCENYYNLTKVSSSMSIIVNQTCYVTFTCFGDMVVGTGI